jgi:hypothetical protein
MRWRTNMDKRITMLGLLALASSLTAGCAVETGSKIILPLTGSPMTPEWVEYNKQAEQEGKPLLMYVVTAKELSRTRPEEPKDIQDTFSLEDERVYIYTRWTNIKGRPRYHLKIYDPRGSVFHEAARAYRFGTERWNLWDTLYIKGWAAARLPGKWRAEIYMDDSLAMRKEFVIGPETHRYEPRVIKADAPTIGVHPYFVDSETSHRDNSTLLPLYISQMLMFDFDKYRVVMPFLLREAMVRPVAKFDNYGSLIRQELKASDSQWSKVGEKYKLHFIIAGAVYDTAAFEQDKKAIIYLTNSKTKDIKEIKASYKSHRAHDRTDLQVRANFYQEIYDQIVKQGADWFKMNK